MINKILSYLLTPVFLAAFWGVLVIFHPLLIIAKNLGGYRAHKITLEWMNVGIIAALRLIGTRFRVSHEAEIPSGRPLIVVSNHQSMYDIPLLILAFRKNDLKFVSKVELSRGIPSISYALRNMGSVLIKRSDHAQALAAIEDWGKELNKLGHSASIFPEGTRAREGKMKSFKPGGFSALVQNMPDALIVPVVIDGSWRILQHNFIPVPFGVRVKLRILSPIEPAGRTPRELCDECESRIRTFLEQNAPSTAA